MMAGHRLDRGNDPIPVDPTRMPIAVGADECHFELRQFDRTIAAVGQHDVEVQSLTVLGGLDKGHLGPDPTLDEQFKGSGHRLNLANPEAGCSAPGSYRPLSPGAVRDESADTLEVALSWLESLPAPVTAIELGAWRCERRVAV